MAIEVTDEIRDAFEAAAWPPHWVGGDPLWEDGLAAVFAIVERDGDQTTIAQAAATAKLYSLAVVAEVDMALAKFRLELDEIKRRYERELTNGPDVFRTLIAAAERVKDSTS